jgi:hypothetical protein
LIIPDYYILLSDGTQNIQQHRNLSMLNTLILAQANAFAYTEKQIKIKF